jgi:uncharacterized protein (TIGR03382 family)
MTAAARPVLAAALAVLALTARPGPAAANGAYTHVHISQLAVELLPDGELKDLLRAPANHAALEAGSMFPDSGYAVNDEYGELAHWPPFQEGYLRFLRERWQGDYSDPEAQRQVAFLLGDLSHGLADQVYDHTLQERTFEVDGEGEKSPDELADYFLVVDQGVVLTTQAWGPYEDLAAVFAEPVGYEITADRLERGMRAMQTVIYIQQVAGRPRYLEAWNTYPFLGTHVYDPDVAGSVPALARYAASFWEVTWARLRGTASIDRDLVHLTLPADGAVNFPVDARDNGDPYRRVGLLFGWGVRRDQVTPLLSLRTAAGEPAPFRVRSPYGTQRCQFLMLEPTAPLAWDTTYVVAVGPGVETIAGDVSAALYTFSFRTRCAPEALDDCPPLAPPLEAGEIPTEVPPLPGPDVVDPGPDAVEPERDVVDAGPDASADTGASADTAAPDTAAPDTAAPDTAAPDTAAPDTAASDTAAPDTAAGDVPGTTADDGAAAAGGNGGGCAAAARPAGGAWAALGLLALLGTLRRRRHTRGRP